MKRNLILFYLLVGAALVPVITAHSNADNDTKKRAASEYEEVMEKFNKADEEKRLKMEDEFSDLLFIISGDIKNMCFDTFRREARYGGGSYPKFRTIKITKCIDYIPNRMIANIRSIAPPKPVLMIQQNKSRGEVVCLLKNAGKTRLENVTLILSGDGVQDETKNISSLMPGKSYKATFRVSPFAKRIRLRMEEKFNFKALPVEIY